MWREVLDEKIKKSKKEVDKLETICYDIPCAEENSMLQ